MYRYYLIADFRVISVSSYIVVPSRIMELCKSLGIKVIEEGEDSISQIRDHITKMQKKLANLAKQDQALHPHVYLQPAEQEDAWSQISTCHSLAETAFKRDDLIDQVKAIIHKELPTEGSPIMITGGTKSGKTSLCSLIPGLVDETTHCIVRFCGLTKFSKTLMKLIISISKQIHLAYDTTILQKDFDLTTEDLAQTMVDLLVDAGRKEAPLVIVIDGLDQLHDNRVDVARFLEKFHGKIPPNVAMVVSLRIDDDTNQFINSTVNVVKTAMDRIQPVIHGNYSRVL